MPALALSVEGVIGGIKLEAAMGRDTSPVLNKMNCDALRFDFLSTVSAIPSFAVRPAVRAPRERLGLSLRCGRGEGAAI